MDTDPPPSDVELRRERKRTKWAFVALIGLICAAVAGGAAWALHADATDHWLAVHTGTINEPGPYYGFWSGFGSDLAEFGILGAIATGVYQLVKKYNCHEPSCWRVGTHPAAGGQFLLCYRHHPEYKGKRPTHEMIERLHREHITQQAAIHDRLNEIQKRLAPGAVHGDARVDSADERVSERHEMDNHHTQ
jgi:hypothetical protein